MGKYQSWLGGRSRSKGKHRPVQSLCCLPLWKVRQGGGNSLVLATLNSVGGLWTAGWYLALGHLGQGKYWLGKRKLEKEVVGGMDLGLVGGFIM